MSNVKPTIGLTGFIVLTTATVENLRTAAKDPASPSLVFLRGAHGLFGEKEVPPFYCDIAHALKAVRPDEVVVGVTFTLPAGLAGKETT